MIVAIIIVKIVMVVERHTRHVYTYRFTIVKMAMVVMMMIGGVGGNDNGVKGMMVK